MPAIPTDFNQDKKENLNLRKDFEEIVSHQKQSGSHKPPKLFSKTNEFVVDWQIPKAEISKR